MKKLPKRIKMARQKRKKYIKKHGRSPYRPRKITLLESVRMDVVGLRDSVDDLRKIFTGDTPRPREKLITAIVKGDMVFPVKPGKEKTKLITSPLLKEVNNVARISMLPIMYKMKGFK